MIYLSGPMTGYIGWNYQTFHEAAAYLRGKGYEVFNPAEVFDGVTSLPREVYMKEDIRALLDCETVMMLDGWKESEGAKLEYEIAKAIGLPVLEFHMTPKDGQERVKVLS